MISVLHLKKLVWVEGAGHAAAFYENENLFMDNVKEFISKYIKD
jgi:hypothetical protein